MWGPFNADSGGGGDAADVSFNGSASGISVSDLQQALDSAFSFPKPAITVNAGSGASISASNGKFSLSGTSDSSQKFVADVPASGDWNVSASFGSYSDSDSIHVGPDAFIKKINFGNKKITVNCSSVNQMSLQKDDFLRTETPSGEDFITFHLSECGIYKFTAEGNSVFASVNCQPCYIHVTETQDEYSITPRFMSVTVSAGPGAQITVTNGSDSNSFISTGSDKILLPKTGTWSVSASIDGNTKSQDVDILDYIDYPVDLVIKYEEDLSKAAPDQIQTAIQDGVAPDLYDVGDTVPIAINGTIGSLTIEGTYYAFVLGFDHNEDRESGGKHSIHFQIGKNENNVDIAFVDTAYSSAMSSAVFRMNTSRTNAGGWESCYMRNTICPAFLNAMPAAWQSAISDCTKHTDNMGETTEDTSCVTATTDKIWLLAEWEVFGARKYANSAEQNYQQQYAYYANGNSKLKYKHDAAGTVCIWWLRSPRIYKYSYYFCTMDTYNNENSGMGNYSYGFAPGFMIAA